jgi:hypothetical protein
MILVDLNGGLGNQMFQYAAAKSLALYHNVELRINIEADTKDKLPDGITKRPFDLNYFNLNLKEATTFELASFASRSLLNKLLSKLKPNYKRKVYKEPFFHFDPDFFSASSDIYIMGLRQSEKYFKPFEKEIRSDFKFEADKIVHLSAITGKINTEPSVALHIRRGDYLAKISLEVLGLMPAEYYHSAVSIINDKITNPTYYIFSDDINWAKENLHLPNAIYVSVNITKTHFEDMYLMSQCRHNIIANSSFSWWAAWLNNNPDKIVIAPKKWFNKGPKDTQDLIPESWIKI